MTKKPKTIKIDGIEIKNHKTVSFTTAFVVAVICLATGALAYHIFMILPQKPGCVQIMVKTIQGRPIHDAEVKIYIAILINETGELVASGRTSSSGRIVFCDVFQPNSFYLAIIIDKDGNMIWKGEFVTNEKSTADFPAIVREEVT